MCFDVYFYISNLILTLQNLVIVSSISSTIHMELKKLQPEDDFYFDISAGVSMSYPLHYFIYSCILLFLIPHWINSFYDSSKLISSSFALYRTPYLYFRLTYDQITLQCCHNTWYHGTTLGITATIIPHALGRYPIHATKKYFYLQ